MDKVTVKRADLLRRVVENKEKHVNEYTEAKNNYYSKLKNRSIEALEELNKGNEINLIIYTNLQTMRRNMTELYRCLI
jgi:hypothetical protein